MKVVTCQMLFTCPFATTVWLGSHLQVLEGLGEDECLKEVWMNLENKPSDQCAQVKFLSKVSWLMWALCQSRNAMIFRETSDDPGEVVSKATELQAEFLRARHRSQPAHQSLAATTVTPTLSVWSPPPANVFKLNFDGAFHEATSTGWGQ
ncbi:uncharacterized protein LOC126668231 [Mercurialis annua]|uniref:uncharacterized protein LOC126668231 n=1 Tax=Mercurialis annua TaxID=3986 RepID=UPI00215E6A79|nr:uncharacterized protein LOC126668231 [Mercurialis annua]